MALERVAMTSLADIPQPDEMGMFGEPGSLGGWSAPSTARSLAMDAPLASRIEYDAEMLANAPLPGGGRGTDELMDVNDQSDRMVPHAMLAGQFERHILTMLLLTHDPDRPDATYEKIREAVLAGADVNLPDDAGVPPLSLACSLGLVEPTRELLDLGADYNSRDRLGNTALHSAAAAGHDEVLGLLIERSGANEPADRGPQVRQPLAERAHACAPHARDGQQARFITASPCRLTRSHSPEPRHYISLPPPTMATWSSYSATPAAYWCRLTVTGTPPSHWRGWPVTTPSCGCSDRWSLTAIWGSPCRMRKRKSDTSGSKWTHPYSLCKRLGADCCLCKVGAPRNPCSFTVLWPWPSPPLSCLGWAA